MRYNQEPVDLMIEDIKDSASLLGRILFAGFNIIFLVVIGVILVSNLAVH